MINKDRPPRIEISAETLAWECLASMIEDFRPFVSDSYYQTAQEAVASRNLGRIRTMTVESNLSPIEFKCQYQIQTWLKRFSFTNDLLSPKDVRDLSIKKFVENNVRLTSFAYELSPLTQRVLFSARGWIGKCLGDFISPRAIVQATFGKKSSVGVPARTANIAERYEHLTGSQEQILWHKHVYSCYDRPGSKYAARVARFRKKPVYQVCDELSATLVNKTWKSFRFIVPNTTIGTLQSSGMGRLLEDCLRDSGYDIKVLQPEHRRLAALGSQTGQLVTADQSSASDNITCKLVDMLFERRWADALHAGRIGKVKIDDFVLDLATFSTMGNGVTFPLQTLVFLGLLKGVEDVLGLKNQVISVFGDDMIYPVEMHALVCSAFSELGLVINPEKTFSTGDFRESCGGDYYRGYDVRPALMARCESKGNMLVGRRAEAYLYSLINALKARWSDDEIPGTLSMLERAVKSVNAAGPLRVPEDFPDTSGVHSTRHEVIQNAAFSSKTCNYRFPFLSFAPTRVEEVRQWPFMYECLRTGSNGEMHIYDLTGFEKILWKMKVSRTIATRRKTPVVSVHGLLRPDTPSQILWEERDGEKGPQGRSCASKTKVSQVADMIPTCVRPDAGRYQVAMGVLL